MAVRITPPGGRVRRKGGAVSLAGGDVPTVTPARDPGVNIPLIPIPVDNTLGTAGAGLQAIGDILGEGSDLALKMVRRDEGLARNADETSYSDKLQDTIRDLQATADLSDRAVVEAVGQQMIEEQERILSEHKGGETSKRLLTNRLIKLRNSFADTLAVLNINAADVRLKGVVDKKISSITQDVLANPDVLISSDPLEAFRFHVGQLEEEIDFLELRPDQARVVRQAGQSEIALSMVTPLIRNGQFDRAKALLRSDEIGKVLSPGQHRDAAQRIIDAERKLAEVKSEGQKNIESARALFPNASEEIILEKARELTGFEEANNVELVKVGEKVLAIDKDTLEVQTLVTGPTIEEDAEREKALEVAKLTGKFEVVSKIAENFGLGELFGAGPTAGDKEDTPQLEKPTSTEKEGEPTSLEVVPPLPKEAISNPFGSEEPPASDDMQKVLGLMALSRVLLLVDETASANGFLSQARMIIDNSREIQQSKDLDKLITSVELLETLGLPLGSTMRDAVGRILPSPSERVAAKERAKTIDFTTASEFEVGPNTTFGELEAIIRDRQNRKGDGDEGAGRTVARSEEERARRRAIGTSAGADQVDAEKEMSFVNEAQEQIAFLLTKLQGDPNVPGDKGDPTLVGALGAIRGAGRSVTTLIDDLGMNDAIEAAHDLVINDSIPDPETGETGLEFSMKFFKNPVLSSLDIIEYSIGVIIARLSTPAGRIPVELIKRSIKLVGLKGLRGSRVIIDRLNFVNDRMLQPRVNSITKRFPELQEPEETGAPEEQDIPPDIPEFRLEGGKFVPVDVEELVE